MKQLVIEKQTTKRETLSVREYLRDITDYSLVSAEEEVELARRIREGDEKALEKLVQANLRFVVSVAKQYQHLGMPLEDLINEGNTGLITAAKRFDETRGFKFISYAVWWIRQAILKAATMDQRQIRLPVNQIARIGKIKHANSKLEQELEREPTEEELGEELDLSGEKIEWSLASSVRPSSMDKPFREEETFTLADTLENRDTPETDSWILRESLHNELLRSFRILSEREREIIELSFGIENDDTMTTTQLATRYGVTPTTVCKIRDRALRRLRESGCASQLKNYLAA